MTTRSVQGLVASLCHLQGSRRPSERASWSLSLSKMKKRACQLACALLVSSSTGWGGSTPPTLVRIVVFANNCTDQSASLARKLGGGLSLEVCVAEVRSPPSAAHAGNARRAAMDIAEAWLVERGERNGVILTTDADSQVAPNWIADTSPPSRPARRRFSDASLSMRKAHSCPRRYIGAVSLRTRMRNCSPNCAGCSTRSRRSVARYATIWAQVLAYSHGLLSGRPSSSRSPSARTKR